MESGSGFKVWCFGFGVAGVGFVRTTSNEGLKPNLPLLCIGFLSGSLGLMRFRTSDVCGLMLRDWSPVSVPV